MIRYSAWTVAGLGLLASSITVVLVGLARLVEAGTCADHPAFVTTRPCPPGTAALILVVGAAFFTGFAGWAAYQWRAPRGGPSPWREGPDFGGFWWPALFLGGAALFFGAMRDFQSAGATGDAWGMGVVGVTFVLMGGVPLLLVARRLPALVFGGPRPPSWLESAAGATVGAVVAARAAARAAAVADPVPPGAAAPPAGAAEDASLVDDLERLADLHRRGVLDDAELAAAKARLLDTDGATDDAP